MTGLTRSSADVQVLPRRGAASPLPLPWRDPHSIPKAQLAIHIADLEAACALQPSSPDLRACLGIAYAMDFRIQPAMATLEQARDLDPDHFWAQFKYAELNYRLRALPLAEAETKRALELAASPLEYAVARRQLQEIRLLWRNGTQKPAWVKPLRWPGVCLGLLALFALAIAIR